MQYQYFLICCLAVSAFIVAGSDATDDECGHIRGICGDSDEGQVCGSDGVTYETRCELYYQACHGESVTLANEGPCPEGGNNSEATEEDCAMIRLGCHPTSRYACGSDGLTYDNSCDLAYYGCLGHQATFVRHGECQK